jgi:hypothetical protein
MSYLCFGRIDFASRCSPEISWSLVKKGLDEGLFVALWPNIVQTPVLEMLEASGWRRGNTCAFLLTGSPVEDTSDSLISPFELATERILANFGRIERWLQRVEEACRPRAIALFMTEGFDDHFREISASTDNIASTLGGLLREQDELPSVQLRIEMNRDA